MCVLKPFSVITLKKSVSRVLSMLNDSINKCVKSDGTYSKKICDSLKSLAISGPPEGRQGLFAYNVFNIDTNNDNRFDLVGVRVMIHQGEYMNRGLKLTHCPFCKEELYTDIEGGE